MKILSYLNVSNLDNIESDSGYIFNYTLAYALRNRGEHFSIILPYEMKGLSTRFSDDMCFYAKMGKTKYEARFFIDWIRIANIVAEYKPDVILLNQSELTAAFRSMLNDNGLDKNSNMITTQYHPYNTEKDVHPLEYANLATVLTDSIYTTYSNSDVPIGLFLSGGIDSGIIASLLRKEARSFSVGYDNPGSLNQEINIINRICESLQITPNRIMLCVATLRNASHHK